MKKEKLKSNTIYEGKEFKDIKVRSLKKTELESCTFVKCHFGNAILEDCLFVDCTFEQCDLGMAKVPASRFDNVSFVKSKMLGIDWGEANLSLGFKIKCDESDLSFSFLSKMKLEGSKFEYCKLHEVDFTGSSCRQVSFKGSDLLKAIFERCDLSMADFSGAKYYNFGLGETNKTSGTIVEFPNATGLLTQYGLRFKEDEEE